MPKFSRQSNMGSAEFREIRQGLGLSPAELARLLDCDVGSIYNIESGGKTPSKQMARLLRVLMDPRGKLILANLMPSENSVNTT